MATSPVPYVNPSWNEQAQGVTQSGGSSAAVPSSGPSTGSANPVLDSLGAAMKQANDSVAKAAATVNNTPAYVSKHGGEPSMPPAKDLPLQNASVKNLANEHPTTPQGARAKGIGLIAAQAGSIVGAYMKKKEAEKTQQLGLDLHRTLELTQGIDQAKEMLQQDPNNAQAKAQLQKNQTLLNSLLSDPKKAKQIAKAYDVTFGDGAKEQKGKDAAKNAPEKQAMQGAMRAQQVQDQMPQHTEINPAHVQAQTQLDATQKQAQALLKTYTTMADSVMKDQTTRDVANANNDRARDVAKTTAQGRLDAEGMRARNELVLNQQRHIERMSEIGAEGANRIKAIKVEHDGQKQQEMGKAWLGDVSHSIDSVNTRISDIAKELDKPENKKSENKEASDRLISEKNNLIEQRNALSQQHDQALMYMFNDPNAAAMFSLTQGLKDK